MSSPIPINDDTLSALLHFLSNEESFVFLESTKFTEEDYRSFLFLKPVEHLTCTVADDPRRFFDRLEERLRKGYYLAGWQAYELGYLFEDVLHEKIRQLAARHPEMVLADFGVFTSPHVFDHRDATFSGAGPWPLVDELPPGASTSEHSIHGLRLSEPGTGYFEKIARIKSYIESGDTYQVNYTMKLDFGFTGSDASFYRTLRRNQNVSYGAYIKNGRERIMSFSPELFFRKTGEIMSVRPMKGTLRRGLTNSEDRGLVDQLRHDIKNCSENVMIVDLLRNDLGRLCRPDTVRVRSLFDVETYETLHQMTSTVEGLIRPEVSLYEMFRALFPCGSVTGAPKIRTMEIIRELEPRERGVYTGSIGFIAPSGEAVFNVPIRTVVLKGERGEMGIGSGIVYDSDARAEWEECKLKASFLENPRPDFKLFETILWQSPTGYWLLELHLRRLAESARYLGFCFDKEMVVSALDAGAAAFADETGIPFARRVRLTLAKDGTMGFSSSDSPMPACITLPDGPAEPFEGPLPLVFFSDRQTDSGSPYLYHKTTLRSLYEEERQKALDKGFVEVFFTNERGEVTEGSISNIIIRRADLFYTPAAHCGLLPGVFREELLSRSGMRLRESVLYRQDIEKADEIYLGNSVRGLVRVGLQ